MRRAPALLVACVLVVAAAPRTDAAPVIDIRNNSFAPAEVRIERGTAVTWTLAEGRHSVTSDTAKAFDSGVMDEPGDRFTFRVPAKDVTIYYHCAVHGFAGDGSSWGSGMVGRIVVGAGSPERATASDVELRTVPSARWPTLDAALDGLRPDGRYRITLARGKYRPLDLTPGRLGLRERPKRRFEVTIAGDGGAIFDGGDTGVSISVDGVRLERLTFRRQRFAGVLVRDAERFAIDDVAISGPSTYGVRIERASRGTLRRTRIAGARIAGVGVDSCETCDLLVDSVSVRRSLQGISVLGGGSVVVRGSTFEDNGVGVALKGAVDQGRLQEGAHVLLNTFRRNTNRAIEPPALGAERDLPVGSGVWIDGGAFDTIERNDFDGHSFGVVVTGPSRAITVTDNALAHSIEADLGWDGTGLDVCFARNSSSAGALTTLPPSAQEVYACGDAVPAGLPFPVVTALVLGWGTGVIGPD